MSFFEIKKISCIRSNKLLFKNLNLTLASLNNFLTTSSGYYTLEITSLIPALMINLAQLVQGV